MGNPPKTFATGSNSGAELVRREIQEIRDALEAFKAAVEAGAGFGPTGGKRSEERASLAFRGVKSRLLFQATSCAQTRFSVAQFRR